jgi:DNA polymerase-3 subunit chi
VGEVYFYHLTRAPLEATLPLLLGKARAAGWRVAVRGTDPARMAWLDERLWLGPEEGFLPHGLAGTGFDADQPILLTTAPEVPNGAQCLMTVDGAELGADEAERFARVCVLFDGHDGDALQTARGQWRHLTGAGIPAAYWSEEDSGWTLKSRHPAA